jgi:hypothetical protein
MPSYIEQCDDYWIARGDEGCGNALVLKTAWSRRYLKIIKQHSITNIGLNERLGWHGSDLFFCVKSPTFLELMFLVIA